MILNVTVCIFKISCMIQCLEDTHLANSCEKMTGVCCLSVIERINQPAFLSLQINIYAANRHPDYVINYDSFDPDRFDAAAGNR